MKVQILFVNWKFSKTNINNHNAIRYSNSNSFNKDRQAFIARRKKKLWNLEQGESLDFGQIILKPYCAI